MRWTFGLAMVGVAVALGACGRPALAPLAPQAAGLTAQAATFPAPPASKAAFAAAVKEKGVQLSEAQLQGIQAERRATPNGRFAARPAEHLDAPENLRVHFLKHGHQFSPKIPSEAAYVAQGNAAGKGERGAVRYFFDLSSFDKGYQSHVVRWVPATHDFTAFMADGTETTYYLNDPKPKRFVEVPLW